jgi:hypothetical protein
MKKLFEKEISENTINKNMNASKNQHFSIDNINNSPKSSFQLQSDISALAQSSNQMNNSNIIVEDSQICDNFHDNNESGNKETLRNYQLMRSWTSCLRKY